MSHLPKIPQKPLVVCIGFLGSQPRHIQKYADLLSTLEVNIAPLSSKQPILTNPDVIQFIPPIDTFFSPARISRAAGGLAQTVDKVLSKPAPIEPKFRQFFPHQTKSYDLTPQKLKDDINNYQPRKIMFFCLSNNGAFGYANFLNYCKKFNPTLFKKVNSQTCGVVWDSSPSFPTPDVFRRGFVSAVSTILGRKPTPDDRFLTPLFNGVVSWLLGSKAYTDAAEDVTNVLQYNIPYHAPQLYLITEKDDLVLPEDTRQFVKDRSLRVKEFFSRFPTLDHYHTNILPHGQNTASENNNNNINNIILPSKTDITDAQESTMPNYTTTLITQLDQHGKTGMTASMQNWVDITEDLKTPHEWKKSTIDQHQLQFGYQYNLYHNIFPVVSSQSTSAAKHPSWSFAHLNSSSDNLITTNTSMTSPTCHLHDHGNDHDHITEQHFSSPNMALDSFEHTQLQHLSHSLPHFPTPADIQRNKYLSTPCYGENVANPHNIDSLNTGNNVKNDSDFIGLSHCDVPSYTHLDVIFTPSYKSEYIRRNEYDKVKTLFEKTERFGDDCHHHFLFDFKDSAHVQHIRKHPEDYKALVGAFCHYAFRG